MPSAGRGRAQGSDVYPPIDEGLRSPLSIKTETEEPFRFLSDLAWRDARYAVAALCIVVAVTMPACTRATHRRTVADPVMVAPSPSEPQKTLDRLGKRSVAGAVAPYTVLFEGPFTDAP